MSYEVGDKLHEECGVFGVYLNHPQHELDAARAAYYGIFALQHRGQESAGIAVSDGKDIQVYKGMGLATEVFTPENLGLFSGHIAVGHVRYSTKGQSSFINAQPLVLYSNKGMMGLAHNGNLMHDNELRSKLANLGSIFHTTNAIEVVANLLARYSQHSIEEALVKCLPIMGAGFALLIITEDCLIGARDLYGTRPLCLGQTDGGFMLASESAAFDTLGAEFIRDVKPGEIIMINKDGYRSVEVEPKKPAHCVFEYIYFARPDSTIDGLNVYQARKELGKQLARENKIDADLVISVPDSGTPSAMGFAEEAGLPFEEGLMKNRYVGRTFIKPSQQLRELGVRLKLNPVKEIVQGKRVVMVDDSIVRGTTSKKIVQMLRDAGAEEVHMTVASPPTKFPCYYGIDTEQPEQLIANSMSEKEIERFITADSLHYISMEGMIKSLRRVNGKCNFCTACFSGRYPVEKDALVEKIDLLFKEESADE